MNRPHGLSLAVSSTLLAVVIVFVLAACASPAVETQIVPETEPEPVSESAQAEAVLPDPEPENIPDLYAGVFGNTSGNINNNGLAAIQGDWIYFVSDDNHKIYAMQTDGSVMKKINDDTSSNINVIGDWVYYLDKSIRGSGWQICAIKTDGSERRVVNEREDVRRMIVVGDWIYYLTFDDRSIYAIKTDGSSDRNITDAEDLVTQMIVDGDWIYYKTYNNGGSVYTIKTDGSGRREIIDEQLNSIFIIDEWIYWFGCTVSEGWI